MDRDLATRENLLDRLYEETSELNAGIAKNEVVENIRVRPPLVVRSSTCPTLSDRLRARQRDKFNGPTDLSIDMECLIITFAGAESQSSENDLSIIFCDSY